MPLPFSTAGPGFGADIDLKLRLTNANSHVGFAIVAGGGGAHVLVLDEHKAAFSANGALLLSFKTSDTVTLTTMGRYVYLAIPTADGGTSENFVHIAGASLGLKIQVLPSISVLPEIGAYWYEGRISDVRIAVPGFQYGFMLATTF